MANYSDIRGYRVKYLSSDPTLNSSTEGQVWYNSTSGTLKSLVQIKAWSSGGNLSDARGETGSFGTQSTAVTTGGNSPGPTTATEEYNGYSWSTGGNLNQARRINSGFGTQTAGVTAGGYDTAKLSNTEEYNGTAWTASNPLNTARYGAGQAGIQTAGLMFNGGEPKVSSTEQYDGTSWTTVNPTNVATLYGAGAGSQTAALAFGGDTDANPPFGNKETESYDGTSWTVANPLNVLRKGSMGCGTQTAALSAGGAVPSPNQTQSAEEWDGSIWYTSPASMAIPRTYFSGTGSRSAAIAIGTGDGTGPNDNKTEEYFSSINNFDSSIAPAWSSGGNLSLARRALTMFGHQTAAVVAGGSAPPAISRSTSTEEYNGASWSSGGALPAGTASAASAGSLTTGLLFGGVAPTVSSQSLEYDGSAWTAGNPLNSTIQLHMSSGTQTTAFSAGGFPNVTQTELYDGTSWTTATGTLNTGRQYGQGAGDSAAGLVFGGDTGPAVGNETLASESWDGTSWTATNPMVGTAVTGIAGGGTQTQAFSALGAFETAPGPDSLQTQTQQWDGTVWSTAANATTARWQVSGNGPASNGGLAAGGTTGSLSTATEEYTYGVPASPTGAAASTLTTS